MGLSATQRMGVGLQVWCSRTPPAVLGDSQRSQHCREGCMCTMLSALPVPRAADSADTG